MTFYSNCKKEMLENLSEAKQTYKTNNQWVQRWSVCVCMCVCLSKYDANLLSCPSCLHRVCIYMSQWSDCVTWICLSALLNGKPLWSKYKSILRCISEVYSKLYLYLIYVYVNIFSCPDVHTYSWAYKWLVLMSACADGQPMCTESVLLQNISMGRMCWVCASISSS